MDTTADVVVVGMGVGGEAVAGQLCDAGLDVIGIEGGLVGGECPYWGCIPSKMAIRAAHTLAETWRVHDLAGRSHAISDWTVVADRIRDEATTDWDDGAAVTRFTDKGGRFIRGWGRLVDSGTVEVNGDRYEARKGIVLGAGTSPVVPPIEGLASTPYWTNREALEAKELPDSLVVLGGGPIGLELAQAFGRFGVRVEIVEATDRLLPGEEPEAGELVAEILEREGGKVHLDTNVARVEYADGFSVDFEDGHKVTADKFLVSTGRKPDLKRLGVAAVGLDETAKAVAVDERMRAGERLWAVGDIAGQGAFTHLAVYQARIAVRDILGQGGMSADYRALPRVTFTDPEVGAVGMTTRQAQRKGVPVATGFARIPSTPRGWIHKAGNEGFIKLVVDADGDLLIGATSAGPMGGEVLSMLTLAVHARVPIATLRQMIYAYPTFHRAVEEALADLK